MIPTHRLTSFLAAAFSAALFAGQVSAALTVLNTAGQGADSGLGNDSAFSGDALNGAAGANMEVRAGDAGTNRNRLAIIRFDLTGVAGDLSGAQLLLTETGNNSRDVTVYGLVNGDAGESWDEATITYNTAPGISLVDGPPPTTLFDPARTVNLGTFSTTGSTEERLTFSSGALDTFLAADTNDLVTFYLYREGGGAVSFRTQENADNDPFAAAPGLNFPNAVPEPATLWIAAIGGCMLGARRRRTREH